MTSQSQSIKLSLLLVLAPLQAILMLHGCGGAKEYKVASVSGVVRCNGEIIREGLVVFEPVPQPGMKVREAGRAASGIVQQDGSYILSTYRKNDGAIVGTHSVKVFAPAPEDDDAPITDKNRYACGNAPLEMTVETGKNVLDLELSIQTKKVSQTRKR